MTKEEILKNFPFSVEGKRQQTECEICAYFEVCDKMLPGFVKPRKCQGPFFKEDNC